MEETTEKKTFSAQELVEKAKAKAEEIATFPVPFLDTEIIFRSPESAVAFAALKRLAEGQVKAIQKTPSPVLKPFKDLPGEIIRQAFWVHRLAVEPPFTILEALQLQEAGGSLPYLYSAIMEQVGATVIEEELETIEDEKND